MDNDNENNFNEDDKNNFNNITEKKSNKKFLYSIIFIIILIILLSFVILYIKKNSVEKTKITSNYQKFLSSIDFENYSEDTIKNKYNLYMTFYYLCKSSPSEYECMNKSKIEENIIEICSKYNESNAYLSNAALDEIYYLSMSTKLFPHLNQSVCKKVIKTYIETEKNNFQPNEMNKNNLEEYSKYLYILYSSNYPNKSYVKNYGKDIFNKVKKIKTGNIEEKYFKELIISSYLSSNGYIIYNYTSLYNTSLTRYEADMIINDLCSYSIEKTDKMYEYYYIVQDIFCQKFDTKDYNLFIKYLNNENNDILNVKRKIKLYEYIKYKYIK